MELRVNRLNAREVPNAARLLARSFAADPIIGYYLTPGWRRRPGFRAFFRAALYEALPHGAVFAVRMESRLVGAAAWLPPRPSDIPAGRLTRSSEAAVRTLYPGSGARLFAGFAGLATLHPDDPHWYLMFVGVDQSLQSRGVGAALLQPVLQRADAEGVLCYLETPFERTLSFYRRLGFEVRSQSQPFEAPATIWTMTRSPRPAERT